MNRNSPEAGHGSAVSPSGGTSSGSATLAAVAEALRCANRVLAMCHIAPDGDAIGSLLGLGWILRDLHASSPAPMETRRHGDKEIPSPPLPLSPFPLLPISPSPSPVVTLVCADRVPPQLQWLAGAAEITSEPPDGPWDVVVALDASDTQRLGSPFRPSEYGAAAIINLDHHVTNLRFGTLNYVDARAVATSQIVFDLAETLGARITPQAAECLLTGIVTDTIGFRTSNMDARAMRTATHLVEDGADLSDIMQQSLNYKPLSMLRLWSLALDRLDLQRGVAWTEITQKMRRQAAAPDSGDGGLVSQLINVPEAMMAAVFSETPDGQIEIGFRSRPGHDVSEVALSLGGGGHPQASGCTIPGPLAAAKARVLPLLWRLS